MVLPWRSRQPSWLACALLSTEATFPIVSSLSTLLFCENAHLSMFMVSGEQAMFKEIEPQLASAAMFWLSRPHGLDKGCCTSSLFLGKAIPCAFLPESLFPLALESCVSGFHCCCSLVLLGSSGGHSATCLIPPTTSMGRKSTWKWAGAEQADTGSKATDRCTDA